MAHNDLNQCNFIGNLGQAPETRLLTDGSPVCNLSVAVGWKTSTKEGTEWIRVSVFGKLAEICDSYLNKGDKVFISGSMRTRKWQDNTGADRYTTEIVARDMQMLGSPQGQAGGPNIHPQQPAPQQQYQPQQAPQGQPLPQQARQAPQQGQPQQYAQQSGYQPRQRSAPQQQQAPAAGADFDDDSIPF